MLVAKNRGANVHPHFAHAGNQACDIGHESELHLLAKEVLVEEKAIMLPSYGSVYGGGLQDFDKIEVEEWHKDTMLRPDIVGVKKRKSNGNGNGNGNGKEQEVSRLWIEIKVTHEVEPEKYEKIKEQKISCIEVDLSLFKDAEVNKQTIRNFLLTSQSHRKWVNNPVLDQKIQARTLLQQRRRQYAQQHANDTTTNFTSTKQGTSSNGQGSTSSNGQGTSTMGQDTSTMGQGASTMGQGTSNGKGPNLNIHPSQRASIAFYHRVEEYKRKYPGETLVKKGACAVCKSHTTREAILHEMNQQKFPTYYRELIMRHPLHWFTETLLSPFPARPTDYVMTVGNDTIYLPTTSPDIYGNTITPTRLQQNKRAINFFLHTLPQIIRLHGTKCDYVTRYEKTEDGSYNVGCKKV